MKKHICIQGNVVLLLLGLFGNIPLVSAALPPPCTGGFTPAFSAKTILQADWNETAVRKVMHAFAYGGFATDQQVQAWASMSPECAIQEILTFQNTNDLISPAGTNVTYDNIEAHLETTEGDATLEALQDFWASTDTLNPTVNPSVYSELNANDRLNIPALKETWISATNKRGINPFRQKVGFWLTNYHMSVHINAVGQNPVLIRKMYDDVMRLLSEDAEGDDVNYFADILAVGAKSPAGAVQYGHKDSRFSNDTFYGNDDFAREFHQLFFGILGESDKDDYELVTVENTARMLTGMTVEKTNTYYAGSSGTTDIYYYHDYVTFDPDKHYPGSFEDLVILGSTISSASYPTAMDKIDALTQIAINNPESEDNLPVWIITHFADDTLNAENDTDQKVVDIRNAWKNSSKNLLHFLRSYAISDQFHQTGNFQSVARYKYRSAFDRNMIAYNQNTVDNEESYLNTYANPRSRMEQQGAVPFYPAHFVFGGQTGIEAANNPDIFKKAYNANVQQPGKLAVISGEGGWQKQWSKLVPVEYSDGSGNYRVGDVGRWLWEKFIADGGSNYGLEERFYVAGLLSQGNTFNPGEGYTRNELDITDPLADPVAIQLLASYEDDNVSIDANKNVGLAVNFITVTPYMFVQVGNNNAGGQ